jgi:AcrR family transcriptional regulator
VREAQNRGHRAGGGDQPGHRLPHFSGKEELFALTLVEYLDELHEALASVDDPGAPAPTRLEALVGAFVDYGLAHPAFIDCAQALMRRSGPELLDEISESALFR